jgi:hypothetical protein
MKGGALHAGRSSVPLGDDDNGSQGLGEERHGAAPVTYAVEEERPNLILLYQETRQQVGGRLMNKEQRPPPTSIQATPGAALCRQVELVGRYRTHKLFMWVAVFFAINLAHDDV